MSVARQYSEGILSLVAPQIKHRASATFDCSSITRFRDCDRVIARNDAQNGQFSMNIRMRVTICAFTVTQRDNIDKGRLIIRCIWFPLLSCDLSLFICKKCGMYKCLLINQ